MIRTHSLASVLLAVAPFVSAAPPSASLPDVEISAPREQTTARTDVAAVCPQIHTALPDRLARAFYTVGREGVVQVQFKLQEGRVSEVRASGGPRSYHTSVRTAVSELDCNSGSDQAELFAFEIAFVNRAQAASGSGVADTTSASSSAPSTVASLMVRQSL